MTRICGARKKATPLRTLQETEIAFMPVLEEAGNSMETRTIDRSEWGSFEQIIIWRKNYQIKIEIYCYSMNTQ
eukprot:6334153-Heterocapsa_arctica.AAC.1